MVFTSDRGQRRHVRRAAQNLGAVDGVPLDHRELLGGERAALVEYLERCLDLADVVHQGSQPELPQPRAVDAERAPAP